MQSIKRFLLVFGVNIGIIVMLSLLANLLSSYFGISLTGSSYNSLMVFALIFGFGGAYINLLISRRMAKRMYKIELIDATVSDPRLRAVYQTVQQIADNNQIRMPEVGIYQDANPNAFATGSSANSSLVAVSSGLLHAMTDEEVKGVVWHEMAHILNGDMVTMTLMQGVLNTFVIFISRVLAHIISARMSDNEENSGAPYYTHYIITMVLEIGLGILSSILLMYYSRRREFEADRGSTVYLWSKQPMIAALQKLQKLSSHTAYPTDEFATMKISGRTASFASLFSSHPPLQDRIEALQQG